MYFYRAIFLASLWAASVFAAATEPDAPHQTIEWQIWAYSTAAPSFIGDNATVLDQNNDVLRQGTNGWTCMPGNARPMPATGWRTMGPSSMPGRTFGWPAQAALLVLPPLPRRSQGVGQLRVARRLGLRQLSRQGLAPAKTSSPRLDCCLPKSAEGCPVSQPAGTKA